MYWIPVSERIPENYKRVIVKAKYWISGFSREFNVVSTAQRIDNYWKVDYIQALPWKGDEVSFEVLEWSHIDLENDSHEDTMWRSKDPYSVS